MTRGPPRLQPSPTLQILHESCISIILQSYRQRLIRTAAMDGTLRYWAIAPRGSMMQDEAKAYRIVYLTVVNTVPSFAMQGTAPHGVACT